MKILLAEDDAVSRKMMQRTLQSFGYEVVLAEDGRKAAAILSEPDCPRLAIVDWMMPELDGPALCREVRKRHAEGSYVYIVMLTSRQKSEDVVAGLEAGADDYIIKPCKAAELRARIHTGCRILSLEEKLVQARDEMSYRATHDGLTAIWNRTSILTRLSAEVERSRRHHRMVSILLCDVDRFKSINDTYGHLAGDHVLKEITRRFNTAIREYDDVGRYGGEEFLIVFGDCINCDLFRRCEEIRLAVASPPISWEENQLTVTISIGAAACEPHKGMAIERLLARADEALYQAKQSGRNRTVLAESLVAG
jgi:diguanylate cyclase (GGDEF)-like protein